jgi:hypothetical protein
VLSSYIINIDFNNETILYFGHLYDALNCLAWHQYWNFLQDFFLFSQIYMDLLFTQIYTIGKFESFAFILTWYYIILNAITWIINQTHVTHVFLLQKWMNNTMFLSQFQHLWRLPWAWNNQNKYISKGHEPTMTKTCLDLNPNHGTRIPRIRTWSVQNVSLNITLLWKHEKKKTWLWCKIVPKIGVEYIKGNMEKHYLHVYLLGT